MSKKPRRLRTPNLPPEAYNTPAATPATPAAASTASPTVIHVAQPAQPINLMTEYKDVLRDLRRTFGIFFGMVIAMLALSFVIR